MVDSLASLGSSGGSLSGRKCVWGDSWWCKCSGVACARLWGTGELWAGVDCMVLQSFWRPWRVSLSTGCSSYSWGLIRHWRKSGQGLKQDRKEPGGRMWSKRLCKNAVYWLVHPYLHFKNTLNCAQEYHYMLYIGLTHINHSSRKRPSDFLTGKFMNNIHSCILYPNNSSYYQTDKIPSCPGTCHLLLKIFYYIASLSNTDHN